MPPLRGGLWGCKKDISQTYNVVQSNWYSMLNVNSSNIIPTLRYTHSQTHKATKWGWGAVYTMDPKVVPRLCKICDWLLNSSWDHFSLHQWKKCQSDHGVQGPQKTCYKAYIIHQHGLCDGRGKRGPLLEKGKDPWQRNDVIINY